MSLPTIKLKHDRPITIATGASRKSINWTNSELLWSELVSRLSVVHRTSETMSEYQSMPKGKRDVLKDVGGFVGGKLKNNRRTIENVEERSIVTLDMDSIPAGVDIWSIVETLFDFAACLYSTHSHTPAANRLRLVMPLSRPVTADEYGAIARRIAQEIGIDYCDDTTFDPCRLMYWASCCVDADYVFHYADAPFLDPDEVLATYKDWQDTTSWPVSSRKSQQVERTAKKQGNPLEKPGVIGAFCKTYDIPAAIEKFLPEVYSPAGPGRFTYAKGSTAGGLVLYEDGAFAFSHHGTDPVGGRLVNSFDLVRIHLHGLLDEETPEDTPVNRMPSYTAMTETALADEQVAYQLTLDKIEAFDETDEETAGADTEWLKDLELTKRGEIADTIDNTQMILCNDPRLCQSFYYDEFKERPIASGDLPWMKKKDRITDVWCDTDDAGLRAFLESEYHIVSAAKIRDAVDLAMMQRKRHPVREYLEGLSWDGEERLETLFSRYLGAEDSRYTRAVTRAALVGAVARIMKPGCKHDHILVLVGPQGCRKSTTLAKLGKEWFSDSLYTMSGKDAYEQIQGFWIIEMGEMAAARKAEIEQIKQFISKQSDSYRAAYGRRTQEHKRQCAFFGSTNDLEFLRDLTGARRFWPVVVDNTGVKMADKITEKIVDQIWAEAVELYRKGERWYLAAEDEAEALEVQKEHTQISDRAGMIREFIEKPVPADWYARSIAERRAYWSDDFGPAEKAKQTEPRMKVCALEIWCELFEGDPKTYNSRIAQEFNAILRTTDGWEPSAMVRIGGEYGRQRGYVRAVDSLLE